MDGPLGDEIAGLVPARIEDCSGSSFLQSAFWGNFKASFAWTPLAFRVELKNAESFFLLVLQRKIAGSLSFAYVPWGPEFPASLESARKSLILALLAEKLKKLLPSRVFFIRFDPPWYTSGKDAEAPPIGPPFCRARADVQPPDSVIVDLEPDEEKILMAMKPKWRYNIGLAKKNGVEIKRRDREGLGVFYSLFEETAKRDGISIHSREYYTTLFATSEKYPGQELGLYIAEHEGEAIAAVIVLFRGEWATYLYGASSGGKRRLMAPHALQWRAMRDAKEKGCLFYDLFGIAPNEDPDHPMAGLYFFKTGFGGRIIHRSGSWDYPCRPLLYGLFSLAEKLRKSIRDKRKR